MSQVAIILTSRETRDRAKAWVDRAPSGASFILKENKRSLPQNDRMWAMLTDVARQAEWAGKKRSAKVWKDLFSAAVLSASNELEVVPGLDGGIMLVGLRTSEMTVAQMADLMTFMEAWGAQNGVTFSDPNDVARDGAVANNAAPRAA